MTDNTDRNHRDIVSLREHLESEIGHVKETMRVFKDVLEVRLEGMNELREQINRERGLSLFRPEHDAVHKVLENQLRSLEISRAELSGKASQMSVVWTAVLTVLALMLSGIAIVVAFVGH